MRAMRLAMVVAFLALACEPPPSDVAAPGDGGVATIQQAATCGGWHQPPCVLGPPVVVTSQLRVDHGNTLYKQLSVVLDHGRVGIGAYVGPGMRWAIALECWSADRGYYDCTGSPPSLSIASRVSDELSSYRTGVFCVEVTLGWADCVVDRAIGVSASTWSSTWSVARGVGVWARATWRLARADGVWCGWITPIAASGWVDTMAAPTGNIVQAPTEIMGPLAQPYLYQQNSIGCGEYFGVWADAEYTICGPGGALPTKCIGWPSQQSCQPTPGCGHR